MENLQELLTQRLMEINNKIDQARRAYFLLILFTIVAFFIIIFLLAR